MPNLFRSGRLALALAGAMALASIANAQSLEITATGRVEAVYLSTDISQPVYLVQLRLAEATPANNSIRPRGIRLPEQDELLFIRCVPGVNGLSSRLSVDDLPRAGSEVRAHVVTRQPGQWEPARAAWFENAARSTPADGPTKSSEIELRGMIVEAIIRDGRLAFAVKRIAASGPAHDAGFQEGDIVVAVDGEPVNSVAELKEFAAKQVPLDLSVVDVNTGQLARVELGPQKPQGSTPPPTKTHAPDETVDSRDQISKSLGIEVTVSRVGLRKEALAVSKVSPAGAGAEAGLEVGDIILAVDDRPTTSADELAAALPAGGGKATLLVRNVRGGDDVPVEVTARPSRANESKPANERSQDRPQNKSPAPGTADSLGLTTELGFYKGEAGVRITGVERGSPAARAGLEAGWLILAADGKPVLHPDELKAAVESGARRIQLKVADPRSGKESEVDITR